LPNLSQSTVVKPALLRVLKLVIIVMVVVLHWGSPAIAAHQASATKAPDDLQSLVMQAADSLDLPLFPLDNSVTSAQAKANNNRNSDENNYIAPLRIQQKSLPTPPVEQAKPKVAKP
jgi:hypothetical protein